MQAEEAEFREKSAGDMRSSGGSRSGKSDFWNDEMPGLVAVLRRSRAAAVEGGKQKLKSLRQVAEMLQPSYGSFFCPITRRIMEDPVTIANGNTYERKAVAAWFESNGPVCPTTREELGSQEMASNEGLRATITEWRLKSEELRIKLAYVALMLGSPNSMVLEAMRDLQRLCRRRSSNADLARGLGATRLLGQFLEFEGSRCEALRALTFFAEDEDEKERIVETTKIEMAVRMLSSEDPSEMDAAVSFFLELSKTVGICRRIGYIPGAILMLITIKYNKLLEGFLVEKINRCLENLEKFPGNIKIMAEDGYLDPLLENLVEGSEETKLEMANLLGKITLTQDAKGRVSAPAISALFEMARHSEPQAQMAALHALTQLSSHPSIISVLVRSGAVPHLVETMFTSSNPSVPSYASMWQHYHSAILADVVDHLNDDPELLIVDSQGQSLTSDYAINNLVNMLSSTASHALTLNVLRILHSLTASNSKKLADRIAKAVREIDSIPMIVEFTRSEHEPLVVSSLKLLLKLAPYLGTAISKHLCEGPGQPDAVLAELKSASDRRVASAELLARLPRDNLPLNKALVAKGAIPLVLGCIEELLANGSSVVSRDERLFLQGLVGILVRFATTCHDADMRKALIEKEIAMVLTRLLKGASDEEILTLSAHGLKNLSMVTSTLSKPVAREDKKSTSGCLTCCYGQRKAGKRDVDMDMDVMCCVHRGVCSSGTFCLVKIGAMERLLACMKHESDAVVTGAISTLQTLVEGRVDINAGMRVLAEHKGVRLLLGLLREERGEEVRAKALSMLESFLLSGVREVVEEIESDKLLDSFLVKGLHHGDGEVRAMCENMLVQLNRMPKDSRHAKMIR